MSDSRRTSAVLTQFLLILATAVLCTICEAKLSTKGGSTVNLHQHLRTKHSTVQLLQVRDELQSGPAPTASANSTNTAPAASGTSTVSTAPPTSSSTSTGPAPATVATPPGATGGRPRARGGTQATLSHFVRRPIDPLRQKALDEMLARMVAKDFQPYSKKSLWEG